MAVDYCSHCGATHPPSPRPLTPGMLRALKAYALWGDQRRAAHGLKIAVSTFRHHLLRAYCALEVTNAIEAFTKMRWLHVN